MESNNMTLLLSAIKDRASKYLLQNGEFAPFGMYVRSNGQLTSVASYSETNSSKEMYEALVKGVANDLENVDIRASAIALDGRIDRKDVLEVDIFLSITEKYQAIYPYIIIKNTVHFEECLLLWMLTTFSQST